MPRRGSIGRNSSSSSKRHTMTAPKQEPIKTNLTTRKSGGLMSGITNMFFSGMAMGAGSEIAHQGIRGIMGLGSNQGNIQNTQQNEQYQQYQQNQKQSITCSNEGNNFSQCLQRSSDISSCQFYLDSLKECQKNK